MFDEEETDPSDDGLTDEDIRQMLTAMMGDVEKEIEREKTTAADAVAKRTGSWMNAVGRKRTK